MISFEKFNKQFQKLLQDMNLNTYQYDDKDCKLPTSDAIFCAEDIIRNRYFFQAIQKAIKDFPEKNIHVVDAGSGTGILGIMALYIGVKKVTMIEENPYSLELSKKISRYFELEENIIFRSEDANYIKLDEKVDILISETIKTNFVEEDFPYIVSNFKKQGNSNMIIIPEGFKLNFYDLSYNYLFHKFFSSYNLNYPYEIKLNNESKVYVEGVSYMYDNIKLYSGDCISYFNMLPLTKNDKSSLLKII